MGLHQIVGRIALSHPLTWWIAWEAVVRLPFLLPHDPSYRALRHFIKAQPKGLFLDIGANNGVSALSLRKMSADYDIYSIEPNALLHSALAKIARRDPRFTFKIAAAGSQRGQLLLHIPIYHGTPIHTLAAGDEKQVIDGVAEVFGRYFADRTRVSSASVDIIRIDDLDLSPTIIKVDVEGSEIDVLGGCTETIHRNRPFLMLEILWNERAPIEAFLKARGYSLLGYDVRNDKFVTADALITELYGHRNYFGIPNERLGAVDL
jgi:FkbM family methyltransferase